MGKYARLGEIDRVFGMTVSDLAAFIGYSRAALYDFEKADRNRGRAKAAIEMLETHNRKMLSEELAAAESRFEARKKAIQEFQKMVFGAAEGG